MEEVGAENVAASAASDGISAAAAADDEAAFTAAVVAAEFEKGGQGAMCEALAEPVRMLQAYELDFWDSVFDEAHDP